MAATTNLLGSNTAIIEYTSGSTASIILAEIHNYIISKGQESLDSSYWVSGTWVFCRSYRNLNADGTSYKYIIITCASATYPVYTQGIRTPQSYNPATTTYTNMAANSDQTQYMVRTNVTYGGQLYLSISDKWIAMHSYSYSGESGTLVGSSQIGMFEIEPALAEDDPNLYAPYCQACGYLSGSISISSATYPLPISLPNIKSGVGITAAYMNLITPVGHQGPRSGQAVGYQDWMQAVISAGVNPFTDKQGVFDLFASTNVASGVCYPKGRLYGLKSLPRGVGQLGDIINIPINQTTYEIDPDGISTKHLILTESSINLLRFAIPL